MDRFSWPCLSAWPIRFPGSSLIKTKKNNVKSQEKFLYLVQIYGYLLYTKCLAICNAE